MGFVPAHNSVQGGERSVTQVLQKPHTPADH